VLALGFAVFPILRKIFPLVLHLVESSDDVVRERSLLNLGLLVQVLGERADAHIGKIFETLARVCVIFSKEQSTQLLVGELVALLHSLSPHYVKELLVEVDCPELASLSLRVPIS